jgi:hypothetical protein
MLRNRITCADRSIVASGVESLDMMYINAHIASMNGTTANGKHNAKNLSRYRRIIGADCCRATIKQSFQSGSDEILHQQQFRQR